MNSKNVNAATPKTLDERMSHKQELAQRVQSILTPPTKNKK